jgi:hypothetical protein
MFSETAGVSRCGRPPVAGSREQLDGSEDSTSLFALTKKDERWVGRLGHGRLE